MKDLIKYELFRKLTDRGKLITAYLYEIYGFYTPIPLNFINESASELECLGFTVTQQDINILLNEMFIINWHNLGNDFFHLTLTPKEASKVNKTEFYKDYLNIMNGSFDYEIELMIVGMSENELKQLIVGAGKYKESKDRYINPKTFIKRKIYKNYL